ncbi:MAG: short-chain dehydrogenase [Segetibacter sp.]|nr:short-chain dehydrogenase [Segetibacter sp.]
MDKLAGKVVWITGASSGIGEALAYAFAKQHAKLVLSARREHELERVKENCTDAHVVEILPMDMEKTDELQNKVGWVIAKMGSIDILVNCAGLSQRSFAKDTSIEVYRKIMEINYFGTIQLSLAVLPHFLQQNRGLFVVMSSVTGKAGLPLRTAYSAAKHAVEGFFSALRTEIWKTNIKILVVRAGAVRTNIATNALTGDGTAFNTKDEIIENGISAENCAKAIVEAIVEGKKELMVGSLKEKLLFVINRFLPGVAFNFVKKLGDKS